MSMQLVSADPKEKIFIIRRNTIDSVKKELCNELEKYFAVNNGFISSSFGMLINFGALLPKLNNYLYKRYVEGDNGIIGFDIAFERRILTQIILHCELNEYKEEGNYGSFGWPINIGVVKFKELEVRLESSLSNCKEIWMNMSPSNNIMGNMD